MNFIAFVDMDIFLDGGDLDIDDQDVFDEQCISDFNEDIVQQNGENNANQR